MIPKISSVNQIVIDGNANENEWEEATTHSIKISQDWEVTASIMHDENYLYVKFDHVVLKNSLEMYPEVLIDTRNDKTAEWNNDDWWIHTSYSNCENKGKYGDYSTCEIGQKHGWIGNNFPLKAGGSVEMKIEKKLLEISNGEEVGIAFVVTDTAEKWFLFPANASVSNPGSWASFQL